MKSILSLSLAALLSLIIACSPQEVVEEPENDFSVNFEKIVLDNGLEVVFHSDRSDPVVAVALTFHVGSAREKAGRTGFAHLFEHLLFLESENLGKGGLDKLSARVGGSGANGSTSRDRTNYFQTVPKDALEKMLWAEADKLGYFINTVTEPVLAKEKQVVKNEKRQGIDNAPYGHTNYIIGKSMYPADHPYNWQVIGSLDDLQNATLDDVKEFYNRWYVPNNATLVVAGDFDFEQAKAWIDKYFSEIPRGEEITPLDERSATLTASKQLYFEDNFARLPELRLTWPGVKNYHEDSYALDILTNLLTDGKTAPFYQVFVEEKKLAPRVIMFAPNSELSGEVGLRIRAYPGKDLDEVMTAVNEAFARFESEGITDADVSRVQAGLETQFYNGLNSVLGKAFQLAQYNIFAGDPGFIERDIENILAVTKDDVLAAYNKYLQGQPYVATSFVPKGASDLALDGSELAEVAEEKIIQGAEEEFDASQEASYEQTASSFDRMVEPPYGKAPEITLPEVWQSNLQNGMKVIGIESRELPLVQFQLSIRGGQMLENPAKVGVANLLADMMNRGTSNKTPEELELAIKELGANINFSAGSQTIRVRGNALSRNYDATMRLVEEMLMEPRWDEEEFALAKQSTLSRIIQQKANPNVIATNQFNELVYGDHIFSNNIAGTEASVEAITLDDLKNYYQQYLSPSVAVYHVVGSAGQENVLGILASLENSWIAQDVAIPEFSAPEPIQQAQVYFYDVPGAKQSVFRFGYLSISETNPDFYPATLMNYILGGGGFASRLTQELREGKGYTYGIGSSFGGNDLPGPFGVFSRVRSNVTLEAAQLVKQILTDYPETFSEQDLETTKSFMIKSNARAMETFGAKLNMLQNIAAYEWPNNYLKQREQVVNNMTVEEIKALATKYVDPNKMIWLVVGDAATQMARLRDLGFGEPILITTDEVVLP